MSDPLNDRNVTLGTLAPHQIVENARKFIQMNLGKPLDAHAVARGIDVGIQDLLGSYQCATPTTFERDLLKIRISALYDAIRNEPHTDIDQHIESVGLAHRQETASIFEDEFWVSLDEHQKNCLGLECMHDIL